MFPLLSQHGLDQFCVHLDLPIGPCGSSISAEIRVLKEFRKTSPVSMPVDLLGIASRAAPQPAQQEDEGRAEVDRQQSNNRMRHPCKTKLGQSQCFVFQNRLETAIGLLFKNVLHKLL